MTEFEGGGHRGGDLAHGWGKHPSAGLALAASLAAFVRPAGLGGAIRLLKGGIDLELLEEDAVLVSEPKEVLFALLAEERGSGNDLEGHLHTDTDEDDIRGHALVRGGELPDRRAGDTVL